MEDKIRNLVFVDTNVFLGLYEQSEVDLSRIGDFVKAVESGMFDFLLPEQVVREFKRNRPAVIGGILLRMKICEKLQIPSAGVFADSEKNLSKMVKGFKKEVLNAIREVEKLADQDGLPADILVRQLFESACQLDTGPMSQAYLRAKYRYDIGDPPGKRDSLGDALNWEAVLHYPQDSSCTYNLVIVTRDGDFVCDSKTKSPHKTLKDEWMSRNRGELSICADIASYVKGLGYCFGEAVGKVDVPDGDVIRPDGAGASSVDRGSGLEDRSEYVEAFLKNSPVDYDRESISTLISGENSKYVMAALGVMALGTLLAGGVVGLPALGASTVSTMSGLIGRSRRLK